MLNRTQNVSRVSGPRTHAHPYLVSTLTLLLLAGLMPRPGSSLPLLGFFYLSAAQAAEAPEALAAKSFFKSVSDKDYASAWKLLTKKSQETIVKAVANGEKDEPTKIRALFQKNDPKVQNGFWDSFRASSKSDQVAGAEFKVLSSDKKTAKVTYAKGSQLTLTNEGGWKLGLAESLFPDGYNPP